MKFVTFAAASTVAIFGATGAFANMCGLNDNQLSRGFTCVEVPDTDFISRLIGNNRNCQDATVTTTSYLSYNANGQLMEDRTIVGEPVQSDWSSSYTAVDGSCNN